MDGGLRALFRCHLPTWHWNSIESGMTGSGIPDSEYCAPGGITGWVEHKKSSAWVLDHNLSPSQVAWLGRRARMGARCFIAVRRYHDGGPRKGPAVDELWLVRGASGAVLKAGGLQALEQKRDILGIWWKGPKKWDWGAVGQHLTNGK